ncbi:hypothetical protein SFRURICE_015360 [Spodoptera frugiperda]|nr:hypothetical protein SFRURICE_015360 [Spodoptera frugiperda]
MFEMRDADATLDDGVIKAGNFRSQTEKYEGDISGMFEHVCSAEVGAHTLSCNLEGQRAENEIFCLPEVSI